MSLPQHALFGTRVALNQLLETDMLELELGSDVLFALLVECQTVKFNSVCLVVERPVRAVLEADKAVGGIAPHSDVDLSFIARDTPQIDLEILERVTFSLGLLDLCRSLRLRKVLLFSLFPQLLRSLLLLLFVLQSLRVDNLRYPFVLIIWS